MARPRKTIRQSAANVIACAAKEIGSVEIPQGSNRTRYGEWYGINGQPWAAIFVSWAFHHAGYPLPRIQPPCPSGAAYPPFIEGYAKRMGEWHTHPQPGDIALYDFGKNLAVHTGIVSKVHPSLASFYSIEGDTSKYHQEYGGRVMRRKRWTSKCRGFYRPSILDIPEPQTVPQDTETFFRDIQFQYPPMEGIDVLSWQKRMKLLLYKIQTDGVFGLDSERIAKDFQGKRNLTVSGVVDKYTWKESFVPD